MEKKKAMVKGLRPLLLLLQHGAAVVVAICVAIIMLHSVVAVEVGGMTRNYAVNPFDSEERFEDSYLFRSIFFDDITNVVQNVVIGSQMGPDGQYDGDTKIDISEYANRKDLAYKGEEITAEYRLEDLLKWYRNGLEYEYISFETVEELMNYFELDEDDEALLEYYGSTEWKYVIKDVSENASTTQETEVFFAYGEIFNVFEEWGIPYDIRFDEYGTATAVTVQMLTDRYLTVNGQTLKECVSSWIEYGVLLHNLTVSVNDLGYNYNMYGMIKDNVLKENTNLRYHVQIQKDYQTHRYTNDEEISGDLDEYYRQLGKYVIYDPDTLLFESNIPYLDEARLRSEMGQFEYAFGEKAKVWIGVDHNYSVDDIYKKAYSMYTVQKDIWMYIGIATAAAALWLFLLIYLSVMAGRVKNKDGEVVLEAQWFDYVPTEIVLALAIGIVGGYLFYILAFLDYGAYSILLNDKRELMMYVVTFATGLLSMVFTMFWYSLIRRLKMHTFWKNSLCGLIVRWIFRICRNAGRRVHKGMSRWYGHLGAVSAAVVPYVFLIFCNLILGIWGGCWIFFGLSYYGWDAYLTVGVLIFVLLLSLDAMYLYRVIRNRLDRQEIEDGIIRISEGETDYQVNTEEMKGENLKLAEAVNSIGAGIKKAVETSMKDERMKADLITNVSHDIKTPLTSIINYVDLLKREKIETEPIKGYIEVLDQKSQRLKQLTDDLVEASKISSGNIVLNIEKINLTELLKQSVGEFSEKFEQKNLTVLANYAEEPHVISADSRRMWRVIENLFNNIYKYAMDGTRVYIDIMRNRFGEKNQILLSVKNISSQPLNVSPEELTERFIRGDESRTTEGSGLGLSIAKSLVEAQGGKLNIILDGDLFKVIILFEEETQTQEV